MDHQHLRLQPSAVASMGVDHTEETIAEVDEPPDEEIKSPISWSQIKPASGYTRAPPKCQRRESLLTRQLHSETEHTDDESPLSPARALSTQSTWSSISMPSTAELTSDDGHSVPSTAGSPPLPPTQVDNHLSVPEKHLDQNVKIVGQDEAAAAENKTSSSEQSVEANLGRKRCISFACRGKQESKPVEPPAPESKQTQPAPSPPKRKCMLKFVCPSRAEAAVKPIDKTPTKRAVSPPPPGRRSFGVKHRGSDSTITHASPKQVRKAAVVEVTKEDAAQPTTTRRFSNDSNEDDGAEATRFHEFATSEDEPEDWTQMSTCYRNRLTVDDTLKKENVIRKTCEEAQEEVLEEEEEDEEEDEEEELAAVAGMEESEDVDEDAEEDGNSTDEGFHSDDEDGFANSDSENDDDSDFEWWKPSGLSTAATSVDHLDRLVITKSRHTLPGTSIGSHSSSQMSPVTSNEGLREMPSKQSQTAAMTIKRPASPGLPDSTDFVCGTLDEDRPLEQAFINRRKQKQAAKKGFRPQDIDPTFPTSDPEMDEEDDEDIHDPPHSEQEDEMMHGRLDAIDGQGPLRRRSPIRRLRTRSSSTRSPPPPTTVTRLHSPPPSKQRAIAHSPPPPARRPLARSPAPMRKLFGHSPSRTNKSPAPVKRMTSPPNSPTGPSAQFSTAPRGFTGRPQMTHTSSLPRGGGITISKLATIPSDEETSDNGVNTDIPKRGAVDIVKGLEKKRQIRKKKLYQKQCAKAANKGEKTYKVKPGTGAERMREIGLGLQEYHGKAEHILSL